MTILNRLYHTYLFQWNYNYIYVNLMPSITYVNAIQLFYYKTENKNFLFWKQIYFCHPTALPSSLFMGKNAYNIKSGGLRTAAWSTERYLGSWGR
jgi:hypothetical protein